MSNYQHMGSNLIRTIVNASLPFNNHGVRNLPMTTILSTKDKVWFCQYPQIVLTTMFLWANFYNIEKG